MAFMRKIHAREFCANILSPLSSSFAVLRFRPFNLKEKYFFLGEMNTLKWNKTKKKQYTDNILQAVE